MKPLLFALAFLLLLPVASAQCTVPGDQEPCDGNVSMAELTDYINLWYTCSACYPDLFEAIEAYYGIPVCGDGSCNGAEDCLSCPGDCGSCGPVQTTNNITQFGITWTFDIEYEYGQFANGDYWVVGPVIIDSVSPGWDGQKHGSMVNPVPGIHDKLDTQGYDSTSSWFIFDNNKRAGFPLTLDPSDGIKSLISTIGANVHGAGGGEFLKTAAILTVLDAPVPSGTFRPPYVSGPKPLHNVSQLRYDLLPLLPDPSANVTLPNFNAATFMKGPWLDHGPYGQGGTSVHPQDHIESYHLTSLTLPVVVSDISLLVMLDIPERENLTIRLVQFGIDDYAISLQNDYAYNSIGGQSYGRKWPILFAGIMLDDAGMQHPPEYTDSYPSINKFGEDEHTYYGEPITARWPLGTPRWGKDYEARGQAFRTTDGRNHNWYGSHSPYTFEGPYRYCCSSYGYVGQTLAAHLMEAEDLWNWPAFFDYVDRWIEEGSPEYPGVVNLEYGSAFIKHMWENYRDSLGCNSSLDCADIECKTKGCIDSECVYASEANGTSCTDDGLWCNGAEACQAGLCGHEFPGGRCTDDGIACTILCDEDTQQCNVPDDSLCPVDYECNASVGCVEVPCTENATRSCNTGLQGACSSGTQNCSGGSWGVCIQDNEPSTENCSDSLDNDCDGLTDCSDTSDCGLEPACEVTFPEDYVSYYMLNNNTDDEAGNNHGTANGAVFVNDAERAWVASFDGTDDYIDLGTDTFGIDATNEFTVSLWVNIRQMPDIFGAMAGRSQYVFPFGLWLLPSGNIQSVVRTANTDYLPSNAVLSTDAWYHVTFTYESGTNKIYVSGQEDNSNAATGSLDLGFGESTRLGAADSTYFFNGMLDDVMIYNRSLSALEIQQIYCGQGGAAAFC